MKKVKFIAALFIAAAFCALPFAACSSDKGSGGNDGGSQFNIADYALRIGETSHYDTTITTSGIAALGTVSERGDWEYVGAIDKTNNIGIVGKSDPLVGECLYNFARDMVIASGISVEYKTYVSSSIVVKYYEVKVVEPQSATGYVVYKYFNEYGDPLGDGNYSFPQTQSERVKFSIGSYYVNGYANRMPVITFGVYATYSSDVNATADSYYVNCVRFDGTPGWKRIYRQDFGSSPFDYAAGNQIDIEVRNVYDVDYYPQVKNGEYKYSVNEDNYGNRVITFHKDRYAEPHGFLIEKNVFVGSVFLNAFCTQLGFVGDYMYFYQLTPVAAEATAGYNVEYISLSSSSVGVEKADYKLFRYNFVKGGKAEEVQTDYVTTLGVSLYNYSKKSFDKMYVEGAEKVNGVAKIYTQYSKGMGVKELIIDENAKLSADLSGKSFDLYNTYKLSDTRFISGNIVYDEKLNPVFGLPQGGTPKVWAEQKLIVTSATGGATLFIDYDGKIVYSVMGNVRLVGDSVIGYDWENKETVYSDRHSNGRDLYENIIYDKVKDYVGRYDAYFLYKRMEVESGSYGGALYNYTFYDIFGKRLFTVNNCVSAYVSPLGGSDNLVFMQFSDKFLFVATVWDPVVQDTKTVYYFGG